MYRAAVLILAAFLALAAPTAAKAKRVALVIGINLYDNLTPNQQLVKAGNDARAVAATFKDVGFQVILAENTGRIAFLRAWQKFLDTVQPGDVTALYYSGHGFEINGSNYLLVRDIPQAADGEEVLKNTAFRLQALMERLKEQRPAVSIFIIDACRDSPYANQGGKRGIGSPRGLKPEEPPKGTLIMMSAGTGQEALDALSSDDPSPNSVYTRLLLPLLKEPGLEITDLAKRLRGNVEALAATVRMNSGRPFIMNCQEISFWCRGPRPRLSSPRLHPPPPAKSPWSGEPPRTRPALPFLKPSSGNSAAPCMPAWRGHDWTRSARHRSRPPSHPRSRRRRARQHRPTREVHRP
jgi:Caspase domain